MSGAQDAEALWGVCVCVCVCSGGRAGGTDIKLNNHSTIATAASVTKHVGHERLL